jgi:hypothetical protein
MSDVSVSLGVTGKEVVTSAFRDVGEAGKQMGETFGSIVGKLGGLAAGYFSVAGAAHAFSAVMEKGGQLADFADQTGIAEGKLVVLGRAFENNGMKAEDMGMLVNKMQKTLAGAGEEGSQVAEKLSRLGLSVSDLKEMTPDEQFRSIAKALAQVQDPSEKAALSMEIFGKAGGRTLALFDDFDNQMAQAAGEVGSFADVMQQKARAFDAIGDGLGAIAGKVVEFTAGLLSETTPALQTFIDYFKSIDVTSFGKGFSETLARGIDVALSIFTNPGNLFLAFGDALILAFKSGGNVFYNGVLYVFDWIKNYATEIIPNYGSLIKASFTAAFGFVVGGFSGMLAEVFTGIAGYLPDKLGRPMAEIGEKLARTSEEWGTKAAVGLAQTWDGISNAAAKATEQTKLASDDWFNAAGSAADLREHMDLAAQSGAAIRDKMQASVDAAKQITLEAASWEKVTSQMADNLTGATQSFKAFTSRDSEAAGLAAQSGLSISQMAAPANFNGINPQVDWAGPATSVPAPNVAAAVGGRGGMGRATDPLKEAMMNLLTRRDYINQSNGIGPSESASWGQLQQRMESRAEQQVNSDLSYYTGGDDRASRQGAIDALFYKYLDDIGGNRADLRKQAEADYNALVNKKLAPGADPNNPRGSAGSGGGPGGRPHDPVSGVAETVKQILDYMKKSLPQHALT